jgi:RHS repeat-associated protein
VNANFQEFAQQQNTAPHTSGQENNSGLSVPPISLPSGGGAIKSIDEKFMVNAVNGTASCSIPLPFSVARGFSPVVGLSYNSGAGNGIFGLGWQLSIPSIRRKTEKQLPLYRDEVNSDIYSISGAEDLVPEFKTDNAGNFIEDGSGGYVLNRYDSLDAAFSIDRYKPRIEGTFVRVERWTEKATGLIHWKIISGINVTAIYGKDPAARIADPQDEKKIAEWLLEFTYDDKGNCASYIYKQEDQERLDASLLFNKNRLNGNATFANSYLKKVVYGNFTPYKLNDPVPNEYMFETVFDYGEHDTANPPFNRVKNWDTRPDSFSVYRPGFEVRTCRLCKRVLLYHHFPELPGGSALTRSLDISYDNNGEDGFTFLKEAVMTGYTKHDDGTYTQRSFPPLSYTYAPHEWNTLTEAIDTSQLVNAPAGIENTNYHFVDLFGEGLSGILTEQNNSLFYKTNLGEGRFTSGKLLSDQPSFKGLNKQLQLTDLEGNGVLQLISLQKEPKGFFELSAGEKWQPFIPFQSLPNINLGPLARMIDLNGDGAADLLVTEDQAFTWYPSSGKKGYEEAFSIITQTDEEKGPVLVFTDNIQRIFLADMSGDGLTDLVRIRNGEVAYWPNLGYGKFGAKVRMNNAPVFDHPEQFNPSYIRLADINGSGTPDIIYFGKTKVTIWLNMQGNRFAEHPKQIDHFPGVDNLTEITIADLLGTGTACLVWNSILPGDTQSPLRYIDIMNSRKPHIMTGYKNNMGKEVEFSYTPSTKYYIDDRLAGTPWITKLHFPVHCVSKVVLYDRIMKTRFASEYSYHHGYYDHYEKEFRGFGRVDQTDSESIDHFIKESNGASNNTIEQDLHQPPILTKTWFHTGASLDNEKILDQFAGEYYQNELVPENKLPEPELPSALSISEWRQALRSCKGMHLRTEIYALDGTENEGHPYTVEQHNCQVKLLQPAGQQQYGVFISVMSESIAYQYERNPVDPCVSHSFIFDIDNYGNPLQSASVVYPRRSNQSPAAEQATVHVTYTERKYTNSIDQPLAYRLPANWESKDYVIEGIPAPANYFSLEQIRAACSNAVAIDHHAIPDGSLQKRLTRYSRTQLKGDDTMTILPFSMLESKGLIHRSYTAVFTDAILNNIFTEKIPLAELAGFLVNPSKGGFVQADNYYWACSGTHNYNASFFYLTTEFQDPFGNQTKVSYDNYGLFVQQVTNALNISSGVVKFNYRALTPYLTRDVNDNLSAIRLDETGRVVKSFSIGKKGIDSGDEFDDTKTEMKDTADFPGSEMEYFTHEWYEQSRSVGFNINSYKPRPNFIKARTRETHYHANPLHQTRWQELYTYSAGSGHTVLVKAKAEPGTALKINNDGSITEVDTSPAPRWVGNGRSIINNKGNAVKQYEPYFTDSFLFDDEKEMVELGVTAIVHHDPIGRVTRVDAPDKTFTKKEFNAWQQKTFDANDTVRDSEWYTGLGTPDPSGPEPADPQQRAAWLAAKHYDTPILAHVDNLGRTFLSVVNDGTTPVTSRIIYDGEGNVLKCIDAMERTVMECEYAMCGIKLKQKSLDAGTRYMISDVNGKPLLSWDDRGHRFSFEYDALQRPVASIVEENAASITFARTVYGENLAIDAARAGNLIGRAHQFYDQAGIAATIQYDFKGNPLTTTRCFTKEYRTAIDWTRIDAISLEPEIFESSSEYNAVNRPLKIVSAHLTGSAANEVYPGYNEAGLLHNVSVKLANASSPAVFISQVTYDEKAQRESILFGNNTRTTYRYDEKTYRLINARTTRNNDANPLQDITYTYDPSGNITTIRDHAQPDIFFDNEQVSALNNYEYDALYRLLSATGRKHAGQTDIRPKAGSGNENSFALHPFINSNSISSNAADAFRNYKETYVFDKAGNILQQRHVARNSSWTRNFEYDSANNTNNKLTTTSIGADTYSYTYDSHGNMHGLESVLGEVWDFLDRLQQVDLGGGGKAYYIYDNGGQRIRKIIERPDGSVKERVYLNCIERYREKNANGTTTLERETLHVSETGQRIAIVDTPIIIPAGNNEVQLIRYQYNNHLRSTALELDDAARIISYEEYFPFGTSSYTSIDATGEVPAKRYRYTGKERDNETGLYYHGARYYLPWLLRWTGCDPAGVVDGLNLYVYVCNNPVKFSDPTGMVIHVSTAPGPIEKLGKWIADKITGKKEAATPAPGTGVPGAVGYAQGNFPVTPPISPGGTPAVQAPSNAPIVRTGNAGGPTPAAFLVLAGIIVIDIGWNVVLNVSQNNKEEDAVHQPATGDAGAGDSRGETVASTQPDMTPETVYAEESAEPPYSLEEIAAGEEPAESPYSLEDIAAGAETADEPNMTPNTGEETVMTEPESTISSSSPAAAPRPTPRESEEFVTGSFQETGVRPERSYLNQQEVPRATANSTRPDQTVPTLNITIEVKNYDLSRRSAASALRRELVRQALDRQQNLPPGYNQAFVIDLRGQPNVADPRIKAIVDKVLLQSQGAYGDRWWILSD